MFFKKVLPDSVIYLYLSLSLHQSVRSFEVFYHRAKRWSRASPRCVPLVCSLIDWFVRSAGGGRLSRGQFERVALSGEGGERAGVRAVERGRRPV